MADNLAGIRNKAKELTSFIEKNIGDGQTFENQAGFNVLIEELADLIKIGSKNGIKFEEVNKILRETKSKTIDNKMLNDYISSLVDFARKWNKSRRDKSGVIMN